MIKLVLWGVRRPGITAAEYFDGNHRVHGDLVRNGPPDFREAIQRYTQSYAFDGAYGRTGAPVFASVSELWYESSESLQANLAHPYYAQQIVPDGDNFADQPASIVHLAVEQPVLAPLRGEGIKVLHWLQTADGVEASALEQFWAPAHEEGREELTGLLGYVRNRIPPDAPAIADVPPAAYEAIWIDTEADIPAFQRYARRLQAAGATAGVLDPAGCMYLLCHERRIIDRLA